MRHPSEEPQITMQTSPATQGLHLSLDLPLSCPVGSALLLKYKQFVMVPLHCRSWDSPFKGSPPLSDSSLYSCHSSYESVNILGDVPRMQAFSAPSFATPGFIEVSHLLQAWV